MTASPHYFGAPDSQLFGWVHPSEGPSRSAGVVLCPPLGHEYLSSHRTYRVLAERLAAAGFAVLRFDYGNTGDSAGDDAQASVPGWLDDIRSAIDELRRITGVDGIALAGLRIGGTLAAWEAAARGGVDALALWVPCPTGRAFTREMQLLGARRDAAPAGASEGCLIEAGGFTYSAAAVRGLKALDLSDLKALAANEVLLLRAEHAAGAAMERRFRELGSMVSVMDGSRSWHALQADSLNVTVPLEELDGIRGWLEARFLVTTQRASVSLSPCLCTANIDAAVRETAVRFGSKGLFGILAEPTRKAFDTAVIILNTGADHRVGVGRISVELARSWAGRGYRVFRIDLTGIGDSPVCDAASLPDPYAVSGVDDVREALAFLHAGFETVLLVGACSGAYIAIRCALAGLPVAGVYAVNPQLYWRPGDPIMSFIGSPKRLSEARRLVRSSLSPRKWTELFKRRGSLINYFKHRLRALASNRGIVRRATETMTELSALAQTGSRSLIVFGAGDSGLVFLRSYLPPDLKERLAPLALVEIADADHTFSRRQDRDMLSEVLTNDLITAYR